MTRNWIAVNLALLLIAALLGWQLYLSVNRFNAENDLAKLQPVADLRQKITQEAGISPLHPPKRYNAADFANIPAQNLFSETRTKEEKVDAPVTVEVPVLSVKPVLVGVTLSGNQRLVSIIDPGTSAGTRKSLTRRIGDSFQGYIITDINSNKMVLENGTRREVIPLYDASKHPTPSGKTAIQPTRIVAIGAGGGSAGAPAAPASSVISTAAARPASGSPGTIPVGKTAASTPAGAQSGIARTSPQQGTQTPASVPQPPATWNERTDDQGRRVIRTPFGDVVRPNPANPPNP